MINRRSDKEERLEKYDKARDSDSAKKANQRQSFISKELTFSDNFSSHCDVTLKRFAKDRQWTNEYILRVRIF